MKKSENRKVQWENLGFNDKWTLKVCGFGLGFENRNNTNLHYFL